MSKRTLPLPHSKKNRIILFAILIGATGLLIWMLGSPSEPSPTEEPRIETAAPASPESMNAEPAAPLTPSNAALVLELFSPSSLSLSNQLAETSHTQQIEQTLTMTFMLTRCDLLSQDDYRDIFRALITYAVQTKFSPDFASAEARVREIANASNASYALIYSRASCDDAVLYKLAKDIKKWSQAVLTPP